MAQTKAIVDKLLTNVSNAYIPENFIAEQVLPELGVIQKTGKIGSYGTNHLRIEKSIMGGRGKARRVEPIVRQTSTYEVESHGLEGLVTEDDYRNVEEPFDAESDETIGLTTMLQLEKEQVLANAMADTATLTQNTTLSGTSQLNDYANSDILREFKDATQAVYDGCGVAPNAAVMSWDVYNVIKYHPGILEALGFKDDRAGMLSVEEVARAMGVQQLMIGSARYESANEGQTSSLASVWGKHIVFYVRPQQAAKYQVSLGYYVKYRNKDARKVYKFDVNNPPESTGIIVRDDYDQFFGNVNAAYLIKNAIA